MSRFCEQLLPSTLTWIDQRNRSQEVLCLPPGSTGTGKLALHQIISTEHPNLRGESSAITWDEKQADFHILKRVREIINQDLSDQSFREQLLCIEKLLEQTALFGAIGSPKLEVSQAHTGVTPLAHTLNVLYSLVTTGLSTDVVRALRWVALGHDLGKRFGAVEPNARYHSYGSAWLLWEFVYTHCSELHSQLVTDMMIVIQSHHMSEGFQHGWMRKEEIAAVLNQERVALMLYALISADISSIPQYRKYLQHMNEMYRQIVPELFKKIQSSAVFRFALSQPNSSENNHRRQNT